MQKNNIDDQEDLKLIIKRLVNKLNDMGIKSNKKSLYESIVRIFEL